MGSGRPTPLICLIEFRFAVQQIKEIALAKKIMRMPLKRVARASRALRI